MKLNFVKLSPTRNITILVTDPVPRSMHASLADQLMDGDCVGGEQVGYIEAPALPGARARLQMMGGEFCGNASMSLAAWLAHCDGLPDGASADVPLEVSGAEGLVNCRILRRGNTYEGTVAMPVPDCIREEDFDGLRFPVVHLPGISHAIVPDSALTPGEAKARIAGWCEKLDAEAMGILLLNNTWDEFIPLVYVRSTGSAVWEHGCGSGTAAIGAYAASMRRENVCLNLSQPGGCIRVEAEQQAGIVSGLKITGAIRITAQGTAWLDE